MAPRYFLDTNIFLYTFDLHSPKRTKADQLVRRALANGEGIISFQVVQEFFNVALRRFAQPLSVAEAEQYLGTVFRPLLAVHSSVSLYFEALRIGTKHRLSWYDALIVAAAQEGEARVLFTEDLNHGQIIGQLRIENPFL
jgi:predicted nucleic acid-binding protein